MNTMNMPGFTADVLALQDERALSDDRRFVMQPNGGVRTATKRVISTV